jgi:Flp pilus assembly protein TadD
VALLREAIAMDPTAARPRTLLGFLFLRQGQLEDAARELDAAKRINFREVEARTELGFVLLRLGREEEALVELPAARDGSSVWRCGAPPARSCSTATS